jgi:hypothetical protein
MAKNILSGDQCVVDKTALRACEAVLHGVAKSEGEERFFIRSKKRR